MCLRIPLCSFSRLGPRANFHLAVNVTCDILLFIKRTINRWQWQLRYLYKYIIIIITTPILYLLITVRVRQTAMTTTRTVVWGMTFEFCVLHTNRYVDITVSDRMTRPNCHIIYFYNFGSTFSRLAFFSVWIFLASVGGSIPRIFLYFVHLAQRIQYPWHVIFLVIARNVTGLCTHKRVQCPFPLHVFVLFIILQEGRMAYATKLLLHLDILFDATG